MLFENMRLLTAGKTELGAAEADWRNLGVNTNTLKQKCISNEVNISSSTHIHWFTVKPSRNGTDRQW